MCLIEFELDRYRNELWHEPINEYKKIAGTMRGNGYKINAEFWK